MKNVFEKEEKALTHFLRLMQLTLRLLALAYTLEYKKQIHKWGIFWPYTRRFTNYKFLIGKDLKKV